MVPNSYVNDDGKPNLNNSNADNDDDGRLAVRFRKLLHTFAPATNLPAGFSQFSLKFKNISLVGKLKL